MLLVIPLETWVFVAILALIGLIVITLGIQQGEVSFVFVAAGITTITLGALIYVKRFRKWIEKI